jgi:inorganic triphosphatase YgiF
VSPADSLEVELKLAAGDRRPLERLAEAAGLGPTRLGPPSTVDERDRYLDTADGRLASIRWACRLRSRGGRTIISLKGPRTESGTITPGFAGGALHSRPEHEGPAGAGLDPAGWPASEARELLQQLTRGAQLVERLALRQRRTEREVRAGDARVGTLSLDAVEVRHGGRRRGELFVVELELNEGGAADHALVAELAAALAAIDGLEPDQLSKLEHALQLVERPRVP